MELSSNRMELLMKRILDMKSFFWLLGLSATITAISIPLGPIDMTLFNLLLIIILFYQVILRKKFQVSIRGEAAYLFFCATIILSIICNVLLLESSYTKANVVKAINVCILYLGIAIFFTQQEKKEYMKSFLGGLYVSCILQIIWGWIQYFAWEFFEVSVNEVVFHDWMKMGLEGIRWTFVKDGHLRLSGTGWEAAYFSLALLTAYILTTKWYVKLIVVLEILASTSRTGLVVLIMLLAYELIVSKKLKEFRKSKPQLFCISFMAVGAVVVYLILNSNLLAELDVIKRLESTIASLENMDASSMAHARYYLAVPAIWSQCGWLRILLGYGIAASGTPFQIYYQQYVALGAWSVESDVITLLMGSGLIGCLAYYIWNIGKMLRSKRNGKEYMIALLILLSGIFYIYIGTWSIVFIALMTEDKDCYMRRICRVR